MNQKSIIRALYRKLLTLYPRAYRERFFESMQQTFNDLYHEWKQEGRKGLFHFVLWTFTETSLGIVREQMSLLTGETTMKNILSNPTSAAFTSLILALPLGLTYIALMFNIEPLARLLNNLLTIDGQQGEMQLNMLGRIMIFGGLLLLPVAFMLNLQPMLKRDGLEGKRRLYAINLIVGATILLLIVFTWGALFVEEIYCLQGIRCD